MTKDPNTVIETWTSVLVWVSILQGALSAVGALMLGWPPMLVLFVAVAAPIPTAIAIVLLRKGWIATGSSIACLAGMVQLPVGLAAIVASVRIWAAGEELWKSEAKPLRPIAPPN